MVHGTLAPSRSAGEYALPVGLLSQVPRLDAHEALALAPGVSITNEATAGDAPEVFLRGFAGNNGQDIGFSVAGIPINDESNPLTHGNADLYFVLPELIEEVHVTEGVADPRQGNFALAGSIDLRLGLAQRGLTVRGTAGTDGYRRLAMLYGPGRRSETFAGAEAVHSDGYGPRRSWDRASGLAQHVVDLGGKATLRLLAGLYVGRWQSPGVLRLDDVSAGRVGFFDVYPGTGDQGGCSTRALASAALAWGARSERAEIRVYGQLRDFRESANPDGFVQDPLHGDLLVERYSGGTLGTAGWYRRTAVLSGRVQEVELGFALRHDRYDIAEQALDVVSNAPTVPPARGDTTAVARVTNPAVYLDGTVRPLAWLTLRGGVRVDAMTYDVDATGFDAARGAAVTTHASAFGVHAGPKATVALGPWRDLRLLASYGTGFRSPDARAVVDGGPVEFTTVSTEDVTLRYALREGASGARWSASLTGFHTAVDQDEVFDPVQATTVAVGPTDRLGAVLWTRVQPVPWIDVNASVGYTRSTVESAALGGRLSAGAAIPYLPTWVGRLDAAVEHSVATWEGVPVRVHGGLGVTVRGPSELITAGSTEAFVLLDAAVGVRVGFAGVDLSAKNLLDARWHSADFEYVSNFHPGATVDMNPVRHFVAGAPRTLFATLTLSL